MTACTYCGCEIAAHEPVFVNERDDGERVQTGQFCNDGCLWAHIDEQDLAVGTTCEWGPAT